MSDCVTILILIHTLLIYTGFINRNGDLDSLAPPMDPRVIDLPFGWSYDAKVDRQLCSHFRLTIDQRIVDNGFFLRCRGTNRGRFRLIVLDKEGSVLFQEEGRKGTFDKNSSEVVLFFTSFQAFEFSETTPTTASHVSGESPEFGGSPAHERDAVPVPVINRLRHFSPCNKSLSPGQYLVCLWGDNVIGKSHVSVLVAQSNNTLPEVRQISDVDGAINDSRQIIELLKNDYLQVRGEPTVISHVKPDCCRAGEGRV